MAVTDVYLDNTKEAGSKPVGCVIYTTQPIGYVKLNDRLSTIIQNTVTELNALKKKVSKLEK